MPKGAMSPAASGSTGRPASTGAMPDGSTPPSFSVEYMDRSVDPATDFYRFAAGRWLDQNPVPADKVRWGAFDELVQRNFVLLRGILETEAGSRTPAPSPQRLVGDFFASAMDQGRIDRLGFAPIQPDLDRLAHVASRAEWVGALADLHTQGLDSAFEAFGYPDKRQSEVYAFYLVQGGLSLPDREYYLEEEFSKVRAEFLAHVGRMLRLVGLPEERAAAEAATVLELETELARASRTRTELRDEDKNYQRWSLDELRTRCPSSEWPAYLAARGVPTVLHVVVGQPEYLEAFDRLFAGRPLEDWKVYLRWHLIRGSARFLHDALESEHFAFFDRTLRGQETPEPRWKRAAFVIDGCLGEALGQLYVERYFPTEARARMLRLIDDLRAVFRDRLAGLPWMSEATRRRALEKFGRFGVKVGHPDRFRDYSSVEIRRDDYLGNVRRASAFEVRRQTDRVGGPVDRTEWGMTPPTVNAYYDPTKNEIVFPAGILQPPFFDASADDALNYGGIGAVIGHEITHGYDDQGRKYDPDGNLRDWWTEEDAREFDRRARVVVENYNRYEALPGVFVNGELTLGENIADLGGLSIAYEALQRRLARDPAARAPIDGLTPEQRFYLAWAQVWRQNCRDAETRRRIAIDPHSPGRFRAQGAATSQPSFGPAFGISAGSSAGPASERRAEIW